MSYSSANDLIPLFKEAAFEVAGFKLDNLTLDTKLSELSLDSVAVMEIVGYLEQKLDVRFNDEDLATLSTLGDLSKLIEKTRKQA